jgi:hypothetical protein
MSKKVLSKIHFAAYRSLNLDLNKKQRHFYQQLPYKATFKTPGVEVGVGVAQLQSKISYCPTGFGS